MIISCTIDNLIRKYCNNFLSYLYTQNGWKRIMFETCKEIFKESTVKDKKVRIVISNTGKILLTCYSHFDLLNSLEYIIEQFNIGRMGHYIFMDNETVIKTIYTETYTMEKYYFDEEVIYESDFGKIKIKGDLATLTYDNWEKGKDLIEIFTFSIQEDEAVKKVVEKVIEKKNEDDNQSEKIVLTFLFIYCLIRLGQLF